MIEQSLSHKTLTRWELYVQVLKTLANVGGSSSVRDLIARVIEDSDLKKGRVRNARYHLRRYELLDYDWDITTITEWGEKYAESDADEVRQFILNFNLNVEGKPVLKSHQARERDLKIVKEKKQVVFEEKQALPCEVCGFDFFQRYGEAGWKFIECHHKVPLAEPTNDKLPTQLIDLALVCSNCHRMLHRPPWKSLNELQSIVQQQELSS